MLSKSILKYIQSLHLKKYRDESGVFIAETPKVIKDLLQSGTFSCKMICAVDSFFIENEQLLGQIDNKERFVINDSDLEKISLLHTPNTVLGIFSKKDFEDFVPQKRVTLLLDDIRDPGNLGTIVRIADWFGINYIICSNDCVDHYNPKVVQASMGSICRVNVIYTSLEQFLKKHNHLGVYAATLQGKSLYSFNSPVQGLLLIGNESKGISTELLDLVSDQITIPRFGGAESLNAAVATGIILSHLVRGS